MITKQYLEMMRHTLLVDLEEKKVTTNRVTVKEIIELIDNLYPYICAPIVHVKPANPETDAC